MDQERRQPRLCHILKGDSGYGFHLHGEKNKTGQYIRKVEPGSPAEVAGLKAGDRVLEVNGVNVEKETHHQVVQRIKAIENETRLLVVDREADEYRRLSQTSSPPESQPNSSAPSSPTVGNNNGDVWKSKEDTTLEDEMQNNHTTENGKQDINGQVSDRCPRLCSLKKGPNGYGFNLHSEKSRPGQFIRSVDPGSPAAKAGLRPQDRLVEVNGQNVDSMKHSDVVANIKSRENETTLLVVDPETDEYFKKLGVTPTDAYIKGVNPGQKESFEVCERFKEGELLLKTGQLAKRETLGYQKDDWSSLMANSSWLEHEPAASLSLYGVVALPVISSLLACELMLL
ncbi:Na(+)/H(+) exchange regulatory cofactor NHE-RF2 [Hyperolius riggenbachi]|uniref:Na(+)/H(+) exchange regulatory cofactor NHE-RF2 n=1 Tax=Hyperolius riggenbachi TaxID=752182 RepID=UPI0035A37F90